MKWIFVRFWRGLVCFYKDAKFYLRYGFKRKEVWDLDIGIAKYLLPRLKYFRQNHYSFPMTITFDKWNEILDDIIFAMEFDKYKDQTKENRNRAERGLKYLGEYFFDLWD